MTPKNELRMFDFVQRIRYFDAQRRESGKWRRSSMISEIRCREQLVEVVLFKPKFIEKLLVHRLEGDSNSDCRIRI